MTLLGDFLNVSACHLLTVFDEFANKIVWIPVVQSQIPQSHYCNHHRNVHVGIKTLKTVNAIVSLAARVHSNVALS